MKDARVNLFNGDLRTGSDFKSQFEHRSDYYGSFHKAASASKVSTLKAHTSEKEELITSMLPPKHPNKSVKQESLNILRLRNDREMDEIPLNDSKHSEISFSSDLKSIQENSQEESSASLMGNRFVPKKLSYQMPS